MRLKKSDIHTHELGAKIGLTPFESHNFICEKEEFVDGSGWRAHFVINTPEEIKKRVFRQGQAESWVDIPNE
ncbi:hypothetical protein BV899_05940 [Alcaligenes phenolicus]|nr:hypothetical protein BV899_05940 [Alcaligenes phenolicus]